MGSLLICFTVAYIIYYHLNYGKWAASINYKPTPSKVTPQVKALYHELSELGMRAKLNKHISQEYIMTISVPEHKVIIEIDGKSNTNNNTLSDLQRTHYSLVNGHYTIRIPNSYIKNNFPQALSYISRIIGYNQKTIQEENDHLLDYSLVLDRAC
ncbi:MAG: endonuclease domain-containing protein [Bacteroidota bacterium]|nr:endonuclease domain-containing protein [Bacteroidota bacterium]